MPEPKNAMEVFQLLDKSNCQQCGEKTCLAFSAAVFRGQRKINECPRLNRAATERFSDAAAKSGNGEQDGAEYLQKLKNEITRLDFSATAERVGARFSGTRLTLKVLGKDFSIDTRGNLSTDIHVNPWVALPFCNYLLYGRGLPASGQWVSFRELKDGKERYPLFQKRCEEPMKRVADVYTDLFDDMVHLFSGTQVDKQFESDISMVLHPLPRVPIMICYWRPEDGIASDLKLFFDRTADQNLDIGSVFSLGAGLAQMFGKLALRHGVRQELSSGAPLS
jgi:hypothetical protein